MERDHDSQCTLWKLQNFTATIFPQKFRQINVLLTHSVEKYYKKRSRRFFFRQTILQKFMNLDFHKYMFYTLRRHF